jgi:hypothetical protein
MRRRVMDDPDAEAASKRKLERELAERGITLVEETVAPIPEKPKEDTKKIKKTIKKVVSKVFHKPSSKKKIIKKKRR